MSRTSWLSNRPHFLWVYRRGNPRGRWENTRNAWVIYKLCECSPNIPSGFPYKIFTEISARFSAGFWPPRFRNLGGQNPAVIQKSRRPKSWSDSEISAAKILPRFRNLGGQNPAVIPKSRPQKSCRDLAEIQKSLGGQNPASRKDAIVF